MLRLGKSESRAIRRTRSRLFVILKQHKSNNGCEMALNRLCLQESELATLKGDRTIIKNTITKLRLHDMYSNELVHKKPSQTTLQ